MSILNNEPKRTNKGLAWAWLKDELRARLGADVADDLLTGYYARLHDEYKDRQRVNALVELEVLRQKRQSGALTLVEARRLDRKIAHRERLLAG